MRVGSYLHRHVSEREPDYQPADPSDPPGWEDCVWAAGVELARTAGVDCPATLEEGEALRRLSGEPPGGPSSTADLAVGMRKRYGWAGVVRGNTAALALPVGSVAVVEGSYRALSTHYRRWQPTFAGGHAATVWRLDGADRVWWCDPLAPVGTYDGEWMPLDELGRFVRGMTGVGCMIARVDERKDAPMGPLPITDPTARLVSVKVGAQLYLPDGTPKVRVSNVNGAMSPFETRRGTVPARAAYISTGGVTQLLLADVADCSAIVPLPDQAAAWERWYQEAPGH